MARVLPSPFNARVDFPVALCLCQLTQYMIARFRGPAVLGSGRHAYSSLRILLRHTFSHPSRRESAVCPAVSVRYRTSTKVLHSCSHWWAVQSAVGSVSRQRRPCWPIRPRVDISSFIIIKTIFIVGIAQSCAPAQSLPTFTLQENTYCILKTVREASSCLR